MTTRLLRRQRGFTLVEAIAVIVITGIVVTFITVFVKLPVDGYLQVAGRGQASDMVDNAMRRMARDLRLALPNSVRTNGTTIEFLETRVGLRYLADDDIDTGGAPAAPLLWSASAPLQPTFTVVGQVPGGRQAPRIKDFVVVYNLGDGQEPANAYANCASGCNVAEITALTADQITLKTNPFRQQAINGVELKSPGKRFHVVSGPVSYHCDLARRRLTRHWDYPIQPAQSFPPTGGSSAVIAENISSCQFAYEQMENQRSGLIGITLGVAVGGDAAANVALVHQVHVDNTP